MVFAFLQKYGNEIQNKNYEVWAELMYRFNGHNREKQIRSDFPKFAGRKGQRLYLEVLKDTFRKE